MTVMGIDVCAKKRSELVAHPLGLWALKLKRELVAQGKTQQDVAAAIGKSDSRVTKWLNNGKGWPRPAEWVAISDLLGRSIRYFCDDSVRKDAGDPYGGRDSLTPEEERVLELVHDVGAAEVTRRLFHAPTGPVDPRKVTVTQLSPPPPKAIPAPTGDEPKASKAKKK